MTSSEAISHAVYRFYLRHGHAASVHDIVKDTRLTMSEIVLALTHDAPADIEKLGSGYLPSLQRLREVILDMEDNARERAEAADRFDD